MSSKKKKNKLPYVHMSIPADQTKSFNRLNDSSLDSTDAIDGSQQGQNAADNGRNGSRDTIDLNEQRREEEYRRLNDGDRYPGEGRYRDEYDRDYMSDPRRSPDYYESSFDNDPYRSSGRYRSADADYPIDVDLERRRRHDDAYPPSRDYMGSSPYDEYDRDWRSDDDPRSDRYYLNERGLRIFEERNKRLQAEVDYDRSVMDAIDRDRRMREELDLQLRIERERERERALERERQRLITEQRERERKEARKRELAEERKKRIERERQLAEEKERILREERERALREQQMQANPAQQQGANGNVAHGMAAGANPNQPTPLQQTPMVSMENSRFNPRMSNNVVATPQQGVVPNAGAQQGTVANQVAQQGGAHPRTAHPAAQQMAAQAAAQSAAQAAAQKNPAQQQHAKGAAQMSQTPLQQTGQHPKMQPSQAASQGAVHGAAQGAIPAATQGAAQNAAQRTAQGSPQAAAKAAHPQQAGSAANQASPAMGKMATGEIRPGQGAAFMQKQNAGTAIAQNQMASYFQRLSNASQQHGAAWQSQNQPQAKSMSAQKTQAIPAQNQAAVQGASFKQGNTPQAGNATPSPQAGAQMGRSSMPIAQGAVQGAASQISQNAIANVAANQHMGTGAQPAVGAMNPHLQKQAAVSATSATQTPNPVKDAGAEAKALGTEKLPEKPDTQDADEIGKPLLDEKAIEETTMFDKPPVSIEEGMKDVDTSRKKRKKLIVIGGIIVAIIAVIVVLMLVVKPPFVSQITDSIGGAISDTATDSTGNTGGGNAANTNSNKPGNTGGNDNASGGANAAGDSKAGTVVYEYTALTTDGTSYSVQETVEFGDSGDCMTSTMNMIFPTPEAAETFTNNLARDYGNTFVLDSLDGVNAVVTIDHSGLHLNREEYENALRYSVENLVVLRK